jgi:hypothetical protein
MKTYTTKNKEGHPITYKGIKYYFLADEQGVGIRRKDNKVIIPSVVEELTEYLFDEGFVDRGDYQS